MKRLMLGCFLLLQVSFLQALPTVKATVLVKDETGIPLSQVDAGLGFSVPNKKSWGSTSTGTRGLTDEEGKFTASGESEQILRYSARQYGYYTSYYEFRKFTGITGVIGFRRWQPWNPTLEVILKKIKNPTAMYVYHTDWIDLPKQDDYIGYDLIKHDWIVPHGKGVTADFLIKISSLIKARHDYNVEFEMKFMSELDGIQVFGSNTAMGSTLKSDHKAPAVGYQNSFINNRARKPGELLVSPFKEGQNYYFRSRCKDDIESCLYGKIYGNIEFGVDKINFTYYLNPTAGDRNVEFDPEKNLFKLRRGYEIKQP